MSHVPHAPGAVTIAAIALMVASCAPVKGAGDTAEAVSGWYRQEAKAAFFQPCGEAAALPVVDGAELRKRAAGFGLQPGDPVYVRLLGTPAKGKFSLARIVQFGSPDPVRDCPMTGTRIQQGQ